MSIKSIKKSSVNFLVTAEFLTARSAQFYLIIHGWLCLRSIKQNSNLKHLYKQNKDYMYKTRGPGALKLVNSIAKYQLQVCQRMYIYALNSIIIKKNMYRPVVYIYISSIIGILYVRFPLYILLILHTFWSRPTARNEKCLTKNHFYRTAM